MVLRLETGRGRRLAEALLHQRLDLVVEVHVLDCSAVETDEVMVVIEHWLGQLVVSVVPVGIDPGDESAPLEHLEVAVDGVPS